MEWKISGSGNVRVRGKDNLMFEVTDEDGWVIAYVCDEKHAKMVCELPRFAKFAVYVIQMIATATCDAESTLGDMIANITSRRDRVYGSNVYDLRNFMISEGIIDNSDWEAGE